jgi:hypothetical protein
MVLASATHVRAGPACKESRTEGKRVEGHMCDAATMLEDLMCDAVTMLEDMMCDAATM